MQIVAVLFLPLIAISTQAVDWHEETNLHWAHNCDFYGNDLNSVQVPGEECGGKCASTSGCSHFTWNDGVCYLKQGQVSLGQAVHHGTAVCGMLKNTSVEPGNQVISNVKGTHWAGATDAGGCQMPTGDYAVQQALALGQSPALGNLVWKSGLCGQVLKVNCGGGEVEAVVASTCNLGSGSCGVDLISKTWNIATGNKQPGIESCSVQLTKTNPLKGNGPVCYFRPTSETSNEYYASLGVINISGKIVQRATLAGISGQFQSGSGWLDFNSHGQPLFKGDAPVQFFFEDGSSASFLLRECRNGGNTYIWS